ncbi:hypothetical protein JWJ90_14805 [Desulfobulbus rhabdoformis]|nr:hypothetical protein [Desulfobulbus rhabdoformis]
MDTPIGPVPRVATVADAHDFWGTIGARIGLIRRNYRVAPGLYAIGSATPQSPVLVTANYKLSFDALRLRLGGVDAWILVVDTRGINVWCAAGKGTFSSEEVIESVQRYQLNEVVHHRELIVPQLAAPGVAAQVVKKRSGWSVLFGPIRSADIPRYLQANKTADQTMREVSFTLQERLVLIPVELFLLGKPLVLLLLGGFLLSGIGPYIFSFQAAWHSGLAFLYSTGLGIFSGAVLTPLFLPWLPFRQFWLKGILTALPVLAAASVWTSSLTGLGQIALALWAVAISSYLAMNFTGSTPFTSPSGVEKEMRLGLPVQAFTALTACTLWVARAFIF